MVNKCYVTGCTNNRDKYCPEDVGIFKFPKDGLLLSQRIDFCGFEDPDKKLPQSAGICTEHFEPEMLIPPIKHWANRKFWRYKKTPCRRSERNRKLCKLHRARQQWKLIRTSQQQWTQQWKPIRTRQQQRNRKMIKILQSNQQRTKPPRNYSKSFLRVSSTQFSRRRQNGRLRRFCSITDTHTDGSCSTA